MFIRLENGPPFFKSNSFSGHEANNLFLNENGSQFQNLTLVSGADHDGDGRGFAKLDFDNDGWLDIALVSTNWPRFRLYKNQLGQLANESTNEDDEPEEGNRRIRIRLQGGSNSPQPNKSASNRDGIGAKILVTYESGRTVLKQRQVGEGNVAQNSGLIWIGFEPTDPVIKIKILWPSGIEQIVDELNTDEVIVVRESSS